MIRPTLRLRSTTEQITALPWPNKALLPYLISENRDGLPNCSSADSIACLLFTTVYGLLVANQLWTVRPKKDATNQNRSLSHLFKQVPFTASVARPYLPDQAWRSGFQFSPQASWQQSMMATGFIHLSSRLGTPQEGADPLEIPVLWQRTTAHPVWSAAAVHLHWCRVPIYRALNSRMFQESRTTNSISKLICIGESVAPDMTSAMCLLPENPSHNPFV